MKNLTRREQILLFVLLSALLIAASYFFVIRPLDKQVTLNKSKLVELEARKSDIDLKLAMENSIEASLEKAIISVSEKFDLVESPLFPAEFERWSLPYLINNKVVMTGLTISDPDLSVPEVPTYQQSGFQYKLRELVDSYNLAAAVTTDIPLTEAQLVRTTVQFKFKTSYVVFVKFLDEIAFWNTTAFVTNATFDFAQSSGSVTIDYYTTEKINIETPIEE